MEKLRTSIYISKDAAIKADLLVIAQRNSTQSNASVSSVVEMLIQNAYAALKRIEPIRAGKKIVGWTAFYGDHRVGDFDLMDKPAAVLALDAYVYEELSK